MARRNGRGDVGEACEVLDAEGRESNGICTQPKGGSEHRVSDNSSGVKKVLLSSEYLRLLIKNLSLIKKLNKHL